MNKEDLFDRLLDSFGFQPTEGQATVMYHLSAFLLSKKPNPTYLLRGYAGTGKTTLVTTLVKTLPTIGMSTVLMAPTGRAAKVMSNYTHQFASTLHKKIYQIATLPDGSMRLTRAENKHKDTVFIVDEASMIGEGHDFGTRSILDDLMDYVFNGERCRLLLIGDTAQLPPIGNDDSPALDIDHLRNEFPVTAATYELTEVKRQALLSGILYNATRLREQLQENLPNYPLPIFDLGFDDTTKIDPETFEELLHQAFDASNHNDSVIICKSNKRANLFNQAVRSRILNIEGEIATGDKLMVVKNNYYWADGHKEIAFIANGDMAVIQKISHYEEQYGFRFANVELSFTDEPGTPTLDVKILLDTLNSNSPALTEEESKQLFAAIEEDYMDIPNRRDRLKEMKKNPWFNALQVKFAYALTCHKTQGGQWKQVFVDSSLNQKDTLEKEDLRWLYTAVTRAQERLYFVNFKEEFFLEDRS
ncbi:MAG: AAA family ATPase [Bacteroidales bacterium]|nr:AAA family ATPase [Bacteroidales bacterium]